MWTFKIYRQSTLQCQNFGLNGIMSTSFILLSFLHKTSIGSPSWKYQHSFCNFLYAIKKSRKPKLLAFRCFECFAFKMWNKIPKHCSWNDIKGINAVVGEWFLFHHQCMDDISVPSKNRGILAKENTQQSLASAHSSHLEFTSSSILLCGGELIIKNAHIPKRIITLKQVHERRQNPKHS